MEETIIFSQKQRFFLQPFLFFVILASVVYAFTTMPSVTWKEGDMAAWPLLLFLLVSFIPAAFIFKSQESMFVF